MDTGKKLMSARAYGLIKDELRLYTKKLKAGYDKVRRRFIGEMVEGMVKSGRTLLSQIAGAVHQAGRTADMHADEKRLSQELKSERWDVEELKANHHRVVGASGFALDSETKIAIDIFDVNKDGSRIFENLTRVHDGSAKETVDGFWAIIIEAIKAKGQHLPLYMELFSDKAADHLGQFTEMTKAVEKVVRDFGKLGLWVMDRGFDSLQNFLYFQGLSLSFLIRGFRPRVVEREPGKPERVLDIVQSLPLRGVDAFFKYHVLARRGKRIQWEKRETKMHYDFFAIEVVHGSQEEKSERARLGLWVLVCEGVGKAGERAFFFTNIPMETLQDAHRLLKKYAHRWSVEEAIRFVKQSFQLEDVRVQSYVGLQRMVTFCMVSYTFLCLMVERWPLKRKRLYWWLHNLVPRRKNEKLPHFVHYRIFEAIKKILGLDFFGFEPAEAP